LLQLGGIAYRKHDYKNCIGYLEKAVKLNCPNSKYFLSSMLKNGIGCDVDMKRSFELCKSAAEQGNLEAIDYLNKY